MKVPPPVAEDGEGVTVPAPALPLITEGCFIVLDQDLQDDKLSLVSVQQGRRVLSPP